MMKKRKPTAAIVAIILIAFITYSITSLKRNYQYGDQMRAEASRMSIQFYQLAEAITHLENSVTEDRDTLGADRLAFDSAMSAMRSHFGTVDAPFTPAVRSDWMDEIGSWDQQTREDSGLIFIFNDEVLGSEFSAFKDDLFVTAAKLDYVYQRYQHMTAVERFLANWRLEQRLLSKTVALNRDY